MPYATLDDIDARYPGELAQAGPTVNGVLDEDAVALACDWASASIDRFLRAIGWTVPLTAPVPAWVVDLAVDLALYHATPTALASQDDFKDRRARYVAALATLDAIANGEQLPAPPADMDSVTTVYVTSNARLFGRGLL
ncbi:MAG: DUF1320 domain-containing protein [Candidatus Contendobacter sp.]|jgi:phage gp36-like protein|nr:DUF1320 domain-containing protein [Candidatus Contendobacter sp.]